MKTLNNYISERLNPRKLGPRVVKVEHKYFPTSRQELQYIIRDHLKHKNYNFNDIDVSQIRDFSWLFSNYGKLKIDISQWTMTQAEDLSWMFYNTSFNGDISDWDVSGVITMCNMFEKSDFNGYISIWNVDSVEDISGMFLNNKKFNQDLNGWHIKPGTLQYHTFEGSPLEKHPPVWVKK